VPLESQIGSSDRKRLAGTEKSPPSTTPRAPVHNHTILGETTTDAGRPFVDMVTAFQAFWRLADTTPPNTGVMVRCKSGIHSDILGGMPRTHHRLHQCIVSGRFPILNDKDSRSFSHWEERDRLNRLGKNRGGGGGDLGGVVVVLLANDAVLTRQ